MNLFYFLGKSINIFCIDRDTKTDEEKLIQLQVKVDKLDALLGNQDEATAR
jgi:hypothetical protein